MRRTAMSLTLCTMFCGLALAQDTARVLFFSKSSGFEHSSISYKVGKPSHVEKVLTELAAENGAELTCTKDGSVITAENLKNYNLVIFYTTGDLFKAGGGGATMDGDGNPAIPPDGLKDLFAWVENGGGFMGFHCATDTFGKHLKNEVSQQYIEFIGAEFGGHGAQFEGKLKLVDAAHPIGAVTPDGLTLKDEWYTFINMNTEKMHVIALMDPGAEREKQAMYNIPNYPVMWCMERGKGRVFYDAMGHREDVWDNETFQQIVVAAAGWSMGEGEAAATPNFKDVVPPAEKK